VTEQQSVTERVLAHIRERYQAEPEFLWLRLPDCAALRHRENGKWFAALMLGLPVARLGLAGDERVDVLNLKCDPRMIGSLVDGRRILRAYHMNKEHWISVLLDDSVPLEELAPLINLSWQLTLNRKKAKAAKKK